MHIKYIWMNNKLNLKCFFFFILPEVAQPIYTLGQYKHL